MSNMVANGISRTIRKRGLRQRFVAEKAGFTEQQLSDMIKGRKTIKAEYLPAIATAIGVEISEIYAAGIEE